ncbi:MAG: ribosome assembly RNA-binding protein YhbY [bacterium]|nr:ribosome assembly RNA-binding protein YhbY [bacterium]
MLTGKQRAMLRSMANSLDTIIQVGKGGINEQLIKQVDEALSARELIKLRVFETTGITAREAATEIAASVNADIVQVIGYRFVLYRESKENKKIELIKRS